MSSINDILNETNLVSCPYCDMVMIYVDYLSHFEHPYRCGTFNTPPPSTNVNNVYISNVNNGNSSDSDDNNYNAYSRMINVDLDLYNPMIDRGLINRNTNTSNNINLTDNMNETNILDLVDIGLGVENLSLYSTKNPIKEDSYCVICMTTHTTGASFYLMKCLHSFCEDCSKRWFDFKSTCPLCKTNMKKN